MTKAQNACAFSKVKSHDRKSMLVWCHPMLWFALKVDMASSQVFSLYKKMSEVRSESKQESLSKEKRHTAELVFFEEEEKKKEKKTRHL